MQFQWVPNILECNMEIGLQSLRACPDTSCDCCRSLGGRYCRLKKRVCVWRGLAEEREGSCGIKDKGQVCSWYKWMGVEPSIEMGSGRPGSGEDHEWLLIFCDEYLELPS